ncbi:MAG: stage V sporulation protein AE [Firmicutes bacterium]|nr:stage V sporulation protein AE [Bacillota bacterium]
MIFLWAFLVGGAICAVGQLLIDVAHLTAARVMVIFVVAGAILSGIGLYPKLIDFAGAGASVPITSFGNSLAHGAIAEVKRDGLIGAITGIFELTSAGISSAIVFGFLASLFARPRG